MSDQLPKAQGYVYFAHAAGTNAYKIGSTVNPDRRLKELNSGKAYRVEYAVLLPCQNCREQEFRWRLRFQANKLSGEWFALTEGDIETIKHMIEGKE